MTSTGIPTVSVVVPTRDRRELLAQALASVRALEGADLRIEIIVADNGSTDGSDRVAAEFGARFLVNETPGAAATRNAGFRAATGDFIVFLDDDDVFLPGHLRQHLGLLSSRPELDAVVGQVQLTDYALNPVSDPFPRELPSDGDLFRAFFNDSPQVGATLARMSVRDTVGYFNEKLFSSEDWDWSLRLALRHAVGFVAVPSILFRQRPLATHDDLQWRRMGIDLGVAMAHWRHAGKRRPSFASATRTMLKSRGHFYWYFVQSSLIHAGHGERRLMRQSLYRAVRASPLHATHDLARASDLRAAIGNLFRSHPARTQGGSTPETP